MSTKLREHLRTNVYGLIAIFIALSGSAIAANTAAKNSVTSKSIKNAQVRAKDLAPNAVSSSKVADDSLTGADIQESSLAGLDAPAVPTGAAGGDLAGSYPNPKIAADAVGPDQVADQSLTGLHVLDGSLTGEDVGDNALDGSDISEGGMIIGGDLSGSVGSADINAGAVGAPEVGNRSLTLNEVAVADTAIGNTASGVTVAPGACVNVGTALNGLQVGDLVIVVPRSTSTGIFTPPVRVTTAGQFPLRMCNHTTTNVTNASADVDVFAVRP